MAGRFKPGLSDPAYGAFAITPGATAFDNPTRALYVGGTGDVDVTMSDGTAVTFSAVPVGTVLPVRATHVTASTTATLLIGLF